MSLKSPPDHRLPGAFLERMQLLLETEFPDFLASYASPAQLGLRANTLKISVQDFKETIPYTVEPVSWCPSGFIVQPAGEGAPQTAPGRHPYHAAGLYYIQDPSAMAAAEILSPQPGERVLDLAAAPGGKATHLAALMNNTGLLVVNEIHPKRVWELAENLERWGARNTAILNETPSRLADYFGAFFDKVMLDAPCSGEGMFRKQEAARWEWSPELVLSCAKRQSAVLDVTARLVRPGGALVYSTCTFAPQENEAVIAQFLQEHPEYTLGEIDVKPGFQPGRPEWIQESSRPIFSGRPHSMVRLWPHRALGEGHFVALLRRTDSSDQSLARPWKATVPARAFRQLYQEFCQQVLGSEPGDEQLAQAGSYLYSLAPGLPDMRGLKVIHPGLWLGIIKRSEQSKTSRFEPAHALAMALKANQAGERASLPSELAVAYLHGEVLNSPGQDGWVLIDVDGFPIGWGKRDRGRLKNFYPKGLRWLS
jgi:NOL1/NOP2/sun family putative RNA methylase